MDIQKYEVFLKVIQCGSFSKAAQAMDYTQSAVTHIIHSMEKAWDVKLFSRNYAGVTLTPEGERLLPLIQSAYDAECRIQEEVDTILGLSSGAIRIGAFASVSMHFLPPIIRQFEESYPGVEFEIRREHYTQIENWLLKGEVDIGFIPEPIPEKLSYEPFVSDRLRVVLPKGHPLSQKETVDTKDLEGEPFVLLDMGEEKHEIEMMARDAGITLNVRHLVKDDYSVVAMVECGLGISVLHELFLQRNYYNVDIRDLTEPTYRDIMVAYPSAAKRSPIIKAFLNHLSTL